MTVDWGALTPRLRTGDQVCGVHGRVRPAAAGPVPACPACGRMLLRVERRGPGSAPVFVEPTPQWCAGSGRHRLADVGVRVAWHGCPCPAAAANRGGHRVWGCAADGCADVQYGPLCTG